MKQNCYSACFYLTKTFKHTRFAAAQSTPGHAACSPTGLHAGMRVGLHAWPRACFCVSLCTSFAGVLKTKDLYKKKKHKSFHTVCGCLQTMDGREGWVWFDGLVAGWLGGWVGGLVVGWVGWWLGWWVSGWVCGLVVGWAWLDGSVVSWLVGWVGWCVWVGWGWGGMVWVGLGWAGLGWWVGGWGVGKMQKSSPAS